MPQRPPLDRPHIENSPVRVFTRSRLRNLTSFHRKSAPPGLLGPEVPTTCQWDGGVPSATSRFQPFLSLLSTWHKREMGNSALPTEKALT
jgi:hypothetical protein